MNIDNKLSKSVGTTQLRSTSQKALGEVTSWPELEILSREKLVQMIYKDNRAGSWTIGSKVSLICRVHCLQQADFVFSRRNELEALSLREYRNWRMGHESLLGSPSDPDSSKYLLAPPNLFTGEYLYFGFEVLMALKREVLIDYIRDHFCGYSTNLIKGRLACRIRVLLRFPRDELDASEISTYEEEQLEVLRNYLANMEITKAEEKQAKLRVLAEKETRQKQSLITGTFSRQLKTKVQCVICRGEISMLGHQARRDKCSVCMTRDSESVASMQSVHDREGTDATVDVRCATEQTHGEASGGGIEQLECGTDRRRDQVQSQLGVSVEQTASVDALEGTTTSKDGVCEQDRNQEGYGCQEGLEQGRVQSSDQAGLEGARCAQATLESFDPMMHRKKAKSGIEDLVHCCECKVNVLMVVGSHSIARCSRCLQRGVESVGDSSSNQSQGMGQPQKDECLDGAAHSTGLTNSDNVRASTDSLGFSQGDEMNEITGEEVSTLVESANIVLEHPGVSDQLLDLGAKISGVLREIEKSVRDSSFEDEDIEVHKGKAIGGVASDMISPARVLGCCETSAGLVAVSSVLGSVHQPGWDLLSLADGITPGQVREAGESACAEAVKRGESSDEGLRQSDGISGSGIGLFRKMDRQVGGVDASRISLPLEGLSSLVEGYNSNLEEEDGDSQVVFTSTACDRLRKTGAISSLVGVGSGGEVLKDLTFGRASTVEMEAGNCGGAGVKSAEGSLRTSPGTVELQRMVMMYCSTSEDEDDECEAKLQRVNRTTSEVARQAVGSSLKAVPPLISGVTLGASGVGIPLPAAGVSIPSWDLLLRGRPAAELRGYIQTHFPHVNVECSSPLVAAKIRLLLGRLPAAVTNEELDVLVRNDGDGYKEWYQSSVLGKSSSSVTAMTAGGLKVGSVEVSSPHLSPRRFPTWADTSSDEDEEIDKEVGLVSAQSETGGQGDSMDRQFLLAARLVLLGEGENKELGSMLRDREDTGSALELGKSGQVVEGDRSGQALGSSMEVLAEGFSPVALPVESDWVGAAAYMEYSRLVVHQPDADVSGRSRGLLLSSMTEAMRIVTGHDFSAGPCHAAILEKRHMQCLAGWSARLINIASPAVGAAIRLEVGDEKAQAVEFVFELYYRHFFSRPNRFHFRYGMVLASMHGYQIQVWTVDDDHRYRLEVSYGSGVVVSRWLVRDLTEDTSRVELLWKVKGVKLESFETHRLSGKDLYLCREQLEAALALNGSEGGVIVEGCFISMADLLQFGRGGKVPDCIMTTWSRICQCVNSVRYIMSSKNRDYIDSVWFLPPSFFHGVLIQEDGAIIGYDVLGFPTLLTDVERLRAKILFVPYCPDRGRWGAGILHIRERDVGYVEHGHSYAGHPGTALFLQALREWFDCQYAMKYDVSLIASKAEAWTIAHGLGSESLGSDDYDSGAQLLLEMLVLAMGTQGSMDITRAQLDQFRWYVVLVLLLPDLHRDQWTQKVSFEICAPTVLQEVIGNVSSDGETSRPSLYAIVGGNGSTHQFDFRHEGEKVSENVTNTLEPMSLEKFPLGLLFEMAQALAEQFTYEEMWLVEHHVEHRRVVQSMIAPAGAALGASDFSIKVLANLLEAEIFVETGAPVDEIDVLTGVVTVDWWLWTNLCSRRKFCELMCARFPALSGTNIANWWRRMDIDKSKFTLVCVESAQSMRLKSPILDFLGSTFPEVMRVLIRDFDESADSQGLYRLGTSGAIMLHSLSVERGVFAASCDLRMRQAFGRLQNFLEGARAYSLEGCNVASQRVVRMSEWNVLQRPNAVADQFDTLMFAMWWRSNMVCDICLPSVKVDLRPLEVLLMLERFEVESKIVHSMSIDLKHVHLLRSLKLKLMTSLVSVAKEAIQAVDRVMELLLDKKVSDARTLWRTTTLDCAEAVQLCREIFSKVTCMGRWEGQNVYLSQTAVPVYRVVVIGTDTGDSITVGLPDELLAVVLHAMERQVMHAAVLYSNYGISAEVSLGKYWSMPRGIKLNWLDGGKRMEEVSSRKEILRSVLVSGLDEVRPLWMVLGLAPLLDTMVRLSYVDGASFSQSEITSVRCRDSLRTLVASERVSVISFSQAVSDYPLGIVGSYGRRTLESMSKDPNSVVARLVQKAKEGRSLDLFTVDHYSTPAEYSTKTLRSMFSVLQWLSEHNIVSTQTTIEFKNVRASEMTEAFYNLLGQDFVTSRIPIDRSPWVEISMRYAEWLRRRGVHVAEDSVIRQFRDSVPDQEVLRLKWQGQTIPQLPLQDTDITESQLSAMGFCRFGGAGDAQEGGMVDIQDIRSRLIGEVKTMRYGHAGVAILPWQTGKGGKKQVFARVYPVAVADQHAEFPRGVVQFATLYSRISDRVCYKVVYQHDAKGSGDLCGSVAVKLGWPAASYTDMGKVVAAMLGQIATLTDLSWKWRMVVEANLSSLQQTLDSYVQGTGIGGPSVWQQHGNLGLFEVGMEQVSEEEFKEQVAFLEIFVAAMLGHSRGQPPRVRVAFRIDEGFAIFRDDMTCREVHAMSGEVLCVIGKQLDDTVYQLIDIPNEMVNNIVKGMQECTHTLTEAMVTQSAWRDHSLSWFHKEWKLRAQWVQVAWKEVCMTDVCSSPWILRKSHGLTEVTRHPKRMRNRDKDLPTRVSSSQAPDLYEACKSENHTLRLGFSESILTDRIVVSGFHATCTVSEVVRQILMVLKLAQLPAEESQVQRGVSQGGGETSTGLKMYIIKLRQQVLFCTRLDKGAAYFFSLLSDPVQVTYGKAQRRERFMVMVSPCPRWLADLRQPAFVSRGHSGVDSADMCGVGTLGWACRHRFPSEVGEMAFIRVQIRVGFLVTMPGTSPSSLLRHANETIVLHFSACGVQQLSLWSWLERQSHWKVEPVHTSKQGKCGRILLREAGSRYDLWKSSKHIVGAGHEHILASADVVGPRAITILSCRKGTSPTDESFPQLLQLWDSQAVNLAAISSIGWVSSKFEGAKGRKRAHNRPSHLSIVWAGDSPEEVQITIPELPGAQVDMETAECVEGMWRSSVGLDGNFISLIPGNIRSYFMMRGQTLLPKRNVIINELLGRGWGSLLDIPQPSVTFTSSTPLKSALKRSISYANAVGETVGLDREEESATTHESFSGSEPLEESKSSVSTLSSFVGEDKVWQEISKLRDDIEKLQRIGDSTALVRAMEDRVHQVETTTRLLQTQQTQTTEVLSEVKRDGLQVAQAVHRMEGCMQDIRDLLQRQSQTIQPMWMHPTSMLEYYRAQIQSVSQNGLVIQDGQRLHGALQDQGAGADKGGVNG